MENKRRKDSELHLLIPSDEAEVKSLRMDLDLILKEIGNFNRYQFINLTLLLFPIWFTAYFSISYVFTAGDLDYRCIVPSCESTQTNNYEPTWMKYSIPQKSNGKIEKCFRYIPLSSGFHSNCTHDMFSKNLTKCDSFIFKTRENTIVSDFGLTCDENKWKIALIGTINSIGQFIGLPITGFFSDNLGRKTTLVAASILSTVFGISRSFSTSYFIFMILEFVDAIVATGIYSGGFILGVELVAPEKRVLTSSIISGFYSVGEIFLGLVMWYFEDWRISLRVIYAPGVLFILYIWLIPESTRWLITKKKYKDAINTLNKISKVNKKKFSAETRHLLESYYDMEHEKVHKQKKIEIGASQSVALMKDKCDTESSPLMEFFRSPRLIVRFILCSFCWMTNTFVFYGLSLNSVAVAGNKYINFILVSLVEIPGYIIIWIVMDLIGRRISLFISLFLSGGSCIAFLFIPEDMITVKLILFLMGKMSITASFTVLYVYTAEMFPTNARHSLLGSCSMFGRIGSMIAPQTPLMEKYVNPLLLFGGFALVAGGISLLYPETLNTKLPDNVIEAENIGKRKEKDFN